MSLAFVMFLAATGKHAAAQTVKIVGIGSSSCEMYADDVAENVEQEKNYFALAQGYMSGLLIRAPEGKDERLDLMPI